MAKTSPFETVWTNRSSPLDDHQLSMLELGSASPTTTGEWTTEPVRRKDGSVWEGLAYINLPDGRGLGSVNAEQAKAICNAHNAALAAEKSLREPTTGEWYLDCTDMELTHGLRHIRCGNDKIVEAIHEKAARQAVDAHNAALTSEREKVQPLVDALTHLMQSNHGYKPEACSACADAAKVKEGK